MLLYNNNNNGTEPEHEQAINQMKNIEKSGIEKGIFLHFFGSIN